MNLIDKIIDKLSLSFTWKGNKKRLLKQNGNGLQVQQEHAGVTNIYQIETLNISSIRELAGSDISQDPTTLLQSTGQRFVAEQTIKQQNLKNIVTKANLTAISNPQEVERDWFLRWMDISQGVSRKDVQDMLSKILEGEVKKTGTFSLRSLDTLKNLSKSELETFQIFCDISYSIPQYGDALTCVISEPFGDVGNNGMLSLGLSYPNLAILQDAGLIQGDLNAWREFQIPDMLKIPFTLGKDLVMLKSVAETPTEKPHVAIINFTTAGLELRSVLHLKNNTEYIEKFLGWIKEKWKAIRI